MRTNTPLIGGGGAAVVDVEVVEGAVAAVDAVSNSGSEHAVIMSAARRKTARLRMSRAYKSAATCNGGHCQQSAQTAHNDTYGRLS